MAVEVEPKNLWLEGKRKFLSWIGTVIVVPTLTALMVKLFILIGIPVERAAEMGKEIAIGLVATGIGYLFVQGRVDNTKAKNGSGKAPIAPVGPVN